MKKITFRLIAAVLAVALLVPVIAGCRRTPENLFYDPPEFIFIPEVMRISDDISEIRNLIVSGDTVFFSSQVMVDEDFWLYDTKLYSMNIDGSNVAPLPNYVAPSSPFSDALGTVNVSTMNADDDGNLWVVESGWFFRFNLPDDFDGDPWDRYQYYEDLGSVSSIRQLTETGAEMLTIDIAQISDGFDWFHVSAFNIDSAGNLYIGSNEGVFVLNNQGEILFRLTVDDWVDQLMRLTDGSVAYYGWSDSGPRGWSRVLRPINLATRDWGEDIELPENAWDIFPGAGDYSFLYTNSNNLFGIDAESGESVKILNWLESNVNINSAENLSILPDGRIICTNTIWTNRGNSKTEVIVLTRIPYADLPERTVLTLAAVWLSSDLRTSIVEFNRTSQTHRIFVVDYSEFNNEEDGWDAGLIRLSTEIISGKIPDILDVSNLPFNQYVARGLLVDLYPFIDADPELNRSDLVEAVFRTAEMDGHLYRLFPSFGVSTVVGNPAVLGSYPGWNMDEFLAVLDANPRADVPMGSWLTKENFFRQAVMLSIDDYVDWATGDVSFDSGAFAQLLEIADRFPEDYDYGDGMDMGFGGFGDGLVASGRQIMTDMHISAFEWLIYTKVEYGGELVYKGFPNEGRNGHTLQIWSSLAVTSACTDKDGAWDFMRTFLLEEWQTETLYYSLPTNQAAFDKVVAQAMEEPEYETWYGDVQIGALTQAEIDQVLDMINNASGIASYDEALMNIIMEGAQDFFSGRSSAEAAAGVVQNRASIYVAEQS